MVKTINHIKTARGIAGVGGREELAEGAVGVAANVARSGRLGVERREVLAGVEAAYVSERVELVVHGGVYALIGEP